MKNIVKFKSFPVNYEKEKDGRKPNTLRLKETNDYRFVHLGAMMLSGDYGKIQIKNSGTEESFVRTITDVSEWQGWIIISWRHRK